MDASNSLQWISSEVYMILNARLHTLEATLSSMIHKALSLVTMQNCMMFGISLRRGLLQLL